MPALRVQPARPPPPSHSVGLTHKGAQLLSILHAAGAAPPSLHWVGLTPRDAELLSIPRAAGAAPPSLHWVGPTVRSSRSEALS
jgi:hypothetical protein